MRLDLIAGLTVVALLVSEGMAYAQIAGMPPETARLGPDGVYDHVIDAVRAVHAGREP